MDIRGAAPQTSGMSLHLPSPSNRAWTVSGTGGAAAWRIRHGRSEASLSPRAGSNRARSRFTCPRATTWRGRNPIRCCWRSTGRRCRNGGSRKRWTHSWRPVPSNRSSSPPCRPRRIAWM